MLRPVTGALAFLTLLTACAVLSLAQEKPAGPPAVLELILPTGARANADGKELGTQRTITVDGIAPTEIRRIKVVVTFPDATTEERLVDVVAGQRVLVPVALSGPDKPATAATQSLTPITSAAISRDGRHIAVGLEDRVVVLWDTRIGRPIRTFAGHQKAILSVAFSVDGQHLLTGSADTTAILWEVSTGRRAQTFKGHTGFVTSVAWGPDGTRVLTGSADATAILWDVPTGKPIHILKGHRNEVTGVAYNPDGATLATASADLSGALWDAASGKQTFVLKGHKEGLSCVAFSPNGRRVGTGSYENISIVWETDTGKRITSTTRHNNDVISLGFSTDGRRIISGDREEVVIMWDAATGEKVRTFLGHSADVIAIATSNDGRMLLTGSRDGTAKLWDLATGRELLTLVCDGARKNWAVVAPDGLFDASEQGRRGMGFRFAKRPGLELDQVFTPCYQPGLLAEVCRGQRPMAAKPLGRGRPPLLKIPTPKSQVSATPEATFTVDVTDQGSGVSGLAVEINGVRVAASARTRPGREKGHSQTTFTVLLAPGLNKVRVKAATGDGSCESLPAEVELTYPRSPEQKSRMYVVAVGVGGNATADARALADLFRRRSAKLYDRVDIIPVFDRDASKTTIEDTVKDVAELTRPQDTLVVLLCGQAVRLGERLFLVPHGLHIGADHAEDALRPRGVAVDNLAAAMGTAPALRRVLIVDVAGLPGALGENPQARSEFALRAMVTKLARAYGIYTVAAFFAPAKAGDTTSRARSPLAAALLAADEEAESGQGRETVSEPVARSLDVTDWFQSAADRAGLLLLKRNGNNQDVQASTQSRGFPILNFDQ